MSTLLHAVFIVVSGNVILCYSYFQYFWSKNAILWKYSKFHVRKIDFWSFWGHFFQRMIFFPGRGCFFLVSKFKEEYFNEKMSSLAGLKTKLFNFPQKHRFWTFLTTWVHLQSRFSQRRGKISKNPWSVSWGRVVINIVLNFQLSIFKKVRGG